MAFVLPILALALFLALSIYLGSSASRRKMAARKIIAGCGAIFFPLYGVAAPEARSESLIMTALAIVIFYYLSRIGDSDKVGE